ncbi:hypothetical protein ACIRPK_23885 [Kitasatospora sp. NPDC101801]|uniref:hypothetical protein n=1 Tax=Kitasatospora sp. NPDC101801 TaxID=3364103 RepID=UPI00380661EE
MSLGWLAAGVAAELPSRHGSWQANHAGLNGAGQYQAVLHDKVRRLLITAVPEGIGVSSWPYGGEPPAGLPPGPATVLPSRHVTALNLAAEAARSHLAPVAEPGMAADRIRLREALTVSELLGLLPEEAQASATFLPRSDVIQWEHRAGVKPTVQPCAPGRVLLEARAPLASVERALLIALPPQDPAVHRFTAPGAYVWVVNAFPVLTPYSQCEPGTDMLTGLGVGRTAVNVFLADNASGTDDTEAGLAFEADLDLVLMVLGQL